MIRERRKMVYVGFKFNHHGQHAGYDIIRNAVLYDKVVDCQWSHDFIQKRNLWVKMIRVLFGIRLWWIELYLIILSVFNPNKYIFHIIYPENIYKYLSLFSNKNEIVLTLHQTSQYFREHREYVKWLGRASKLIVMSAALEDYFGKTFPLLPVKFIPHPVDTDFFKFSDKKENQVILVGNWLRDHSFANDVFAGLDEGIKIVVVTSEANWHFYDDKIVSLQSNISDHDLVRLYQQSKVLFLPLISYTANNALAEAILCGCKVIVASDNLDLRVFKIKDNPVTVDLNVQKTINLIHSEMKNWNKENARHDSESAGSYYSNAVIGRKTELYLIE